MDSSKLPFSLFDFFALIFPGAIAVFGIYIYLDPLFTWLRDATLGLPLTFAFIVLSYVLGHIFHAASEILIDRLSNVTIGSMVGQYLMKMGLVERIRGKQIKALRSLLQVEWDPDILFAWVEEKPQVEEKKLEEKSHIVSAEAHDEKPKAETKTAEEKPDLVTGRLIKHCIESEFHKRPETINHTFQLILAFSQKYTKGETNEVPVFAALEAMFRSLALATILLYGVLFVRLYRIISLAELLALSSVPVFLIILFIYAYQRYKRMWVQTIFAQFIVASSGRPFSAGAPASLPHPDI